MMKNRITIRMAVLLSCMILALSLCGCDVSQSAEKEPLPPQDFSEVYNDGVVVVETKRLLRLPAGGAESEYCYLEVRLTNNGTMPIYYSSMLCLSVSSGGAEFPRGNIVDASNLAHTGIEGFETLDGVIDTGETAQGFVIFEAPAGTQQFDISLATNFCSDEWVSFTCGVSEE